MSGHESHENVVKRLKRANGHLLSVIEMITDERPCLDVAQQLHAVAKAVSNAKQIYIKDHIEHCFDVEAMSDPKTIKKNMDAFKEITKYLE